MNTAATATKTKLWNDEQEAKKTDYVKRRLRAEWKDRTYTWRWRAAHEKVDT